MTTPEHPLIPDRVGDLIRKASTIAESVPAHDPRPPRRRSALIGGLLVATIAGAATWMIISGDKSSTEGVPGSTLADGAAQVSATTASALDTSDNATDTTAGSATTDAPQTTAAASASTAPATTEPSPTTTQADVATTTSTPSSTTSPAATTAVETTAPEVLSGFPQATLPGGQTWPNALYQDDILYLRGTLPSREVADRLVTQMVALLGEDLVVDQIEIDPTVPLVEYAAVTLGNSVLFQSGDFDIPKVSEFGFTLWGVFLNANPDVELTIIGHTDSVGSDEYNQQLALTRALVARDQIAKTAPEVIERVKVEGRGPEEPIASNETVAGRALNRRVEFAVRGFFTSDSMSDS